MIPKTVRMSEDMWDKLDKIYEETGINRGIFIRNAIELAIKKYRKEE